MPKTLTSEEILSHILKLDTAAQIQLGYKIKDTLQEKADHLKHQKETAESELNSITTALKQL